MTDGDMLDNDQALEAENAPNRPMQTAQQCDFVTPRTADS